ncbi:MAG: toll/interleukin-1 receptor domain-containing protein [Ruminococcus sp.]|nr:toll/interleukin-1 receptor domain-containing protein [Ruminococcus sp.]
MVFNCKMCGANLNVKSGMRICKCDYCDSVQTIPDLSSEKKLQLFNKANALRFACDFDRAGDVYRDIIEDFPEEAEAYWGLCLCKYGIEYVVDPETQNRVPTCHRTSFEKIQDIPEFRKVLEYSDINLRNIYIQLAEVIDGIQQGILEIAVNEKPFDVFICYKETNENGGRSADALLAEKLYSELTAQNIKTFFAPVTLKGKLGTEFEPYIYSAINSAQVMVCVGTSPEHFDSVWVRNEWSRFIEIMKKDKSKILIPCYSDMSVGQLPVEFRGFQAQDLTETNAFENVVKNVQDIMTASEGAKSQLNVLMEKFEGQLRNERSKLRMLENVHHQQMVYEKKNAKKMFKKEYIPLFPLVFLEIMIVGIVSFILTMLYATFDFDIMLVPIGVLIFSALPACIALPRINKRNKKARENLSRRLAYDENAPDFDYGSQKSEVVQLREIAMKNYEKQHFSVSKIIGLYWLWSWFSFLPKSFIEGILGYSYHKFSPVFTVIFNVIIPVIALAFIIRRNIKLKKQLNEKLEEINKKNKI